MRRRYVWDRGSRAASESRWPWSLSIAENEVEEPRSWQLRSREHPCKAARDGGVGERGSGAGGRALGAGRFRQRGDPIADLAHEVHRRMDAAIVGEDRIAAQARRIAG